MDCITRLLLVAIALALCGCTAKSPPPGSPERARLDLYEEFERERAALRKPEVEYPDTAALQKPEVKYPETAMLQVISTDQVSAGSVMKFRGKLYNPLPETVRGTWLLMRLYTSPENPRQLDVLQKEMTTTLPSGDSTPLRWDAESMYWGSSGPVWFVIEAYPKRVGDKELQPPAGWRE